MSQHNVSSSTCMHEAHNIVKLMNNSISIMKPIVASEDYTHLEETIYVNASQPTSVMIPIVDNDILESDKTFQVEIGLQNSEDRNCVIVQPNVFDIMILDDDCELYKFNDDTI